MKLELATFKDLLGRLLSHKKNYVESFHNPTQKKIE
jgi:hypothetical protein